jgi:hypothetical protein
MSKFFIENEEEGAKNIFKKKQMFKTVSRSELGNLIDFNYGEKRLYGRVDRYFQPVVPNNEYLEIVNLKTSTADPIRVFNFVADAFAELQNKFKIKVANGEISDSEEFLTMLVPTAAYLDPKEIFYNYNQAFSIAVGNVISDNNLKFKNFREFINVIMPYIKNYLKNKTVTYPAFVKSKDCPMNVSGLVIELAVIEPNDDKTKYEKFYKSKNWDFFLNACNTYGFMVDCNMPNKIVADINSINMVNKMKSYNTEISSGNLFMANCYDSVANSHYDTFKLFLYNIYSDNRPKTIVTTVNNQHNGTRAIVKKVKSYKYDDFTNEIGESYLLDLYLNIRFLEEESKFTEYERNTIIRDTVNLSKIDGMVSAITIFEKILNKTFDYSGSLSYVKKRRDDLRK